MAAKQQQQQRGATAATTTTSAAAVSSLLGPAFAALKSSPASSLSAGQWLVGKKPATLTMSASSSSSRGGVLVQARRKEKERERERKREEEKTALVFALTHVFLSLSPRLVPFSLIETDPRRREEARGRLRSLPRGVQDGPSVCDGGRKSRRRRGRGRLRQLDFGRRRQEGPSSFSSRFSSCSSSRRRARRLVAGSGERGAGAKDVLKTK